MRAVSIVGVGQTPVGEHWTESLRDLGAVALLAALKDATRPHPDAIYVANAYSASVSEQSQLGALIADYAGLTGTEAFTIEAGDASGAAALRVGYMAVASGLLDTVAIVGVEKMTDAVAAERVRARSVGLDADYEAAHGATLPALAGLLMRRYMHDYNVDLSVFEGFSINAHRNGSLNRNAMFRNKLRPGAFSKAPMVASPVSLFDGAPDGDGAAAVILTATDLLTAVDESPVEIAASSAATDTLSLQDREDLLWLGAVASSTESALNVAGISRDQVDLYELHDAFTVLSALSLEAAGFASRGTGWKLAADEAAQIGLMGQLPLSTFGGLKSRGNPAGATGIYQAVEATMQLRGNAGDNQIPDAHVALIQSLGGLASTVITHILRA